MDGAPASKKTKPLGPMSGLEMAAYLKIMSESLLLAGADLSEDGVNGTDLDSTLDDVLDAIICSSSVLMCSIGQLETVDRAAAGIVQVEKSLVDNAPLLMPCLK